jgi:hypothetical protein
MPSSGIILQRRLESENTKNTLRTGPKLLLRSALPNPNVMPPPHMFV